MNRIYHTTVIISFDVWEPQQDVVKAELDSVIRTAKSALVHAVRLKVASEQHEETLAT